MTDNYEKDQACMTAHKVPSRLGKEPLLDVVCGVNFRSKLPAASMLPGLLLPVLEGSQTKFEALPIAQLPQIVRDQNPALLNAPEMRVIVDDQFAILIGSQWLGVGCLMPYPGWARFKDMILKVFSIFKNASFIEKIERHSIKYVDFFPTVSGGGEISRFNAKIEIAGRRLSSQATQLRTEILEGPFLHAVTIVAPATVSRSGGNEEGSIVDVDTHRIQQYESVNEFLSAMPILLDEIHTANKNFFFDMLSEKLVDELEPHYG